MTSEAHGLEESYMEKPKRVTTWSGLSVNELYAPQDMVNIDYHRDLGDAGEYPFTRGIHRNMFRGKLWTRRQICGYGTPQDTNQRIKFLIKEGASGLFVIPDGTTHHYVDGDHSIARGEVGRLGAVLYTLGDMEETFDGVPIDKITISFAAQSPIVLAEYFITAGQTDNSLQGMSWGGIRLCSKTEI